LRDGWRETDLRDVADLNPESVSRTTPPVEIDYIDIAAVSAVGVDVEAVRTLPFADAPSRAQRVVRAGDVIVSTVRPYLRARALIRAELDGCVASTGFCVIRPSPSLVPGYLDAVTSTDEFYSHLESRQTGSAYPAVRPGDVGDAQIPLAPLKDQRRIAELLASVDCCSEASKRAAMAVERLLARTRESVVSAGESSAALGDVILEIGVGESPRCLDRPPLPSEWGVLKVSAVRPARFIPTEAKALPPDKAPKLGAGLAEGDLLVTRSNTLDRVGAACVARGEVKNLLLSDLIFRIKLDEEVLLPEFAANALSSQGLRRQIEAAAVGTSGSMKKVNQTILRSLTVPCPPIDEQRRALRTLRAVEAAVEVQQSKVQDLRRLRSALLCALLSGEHEIPESYDRFLSEDGAMRDLQPIAV